MASQPPLPNSAVRKCYKCEHENPITQGFCGACGSHTDLSDYISSKVKAEVHHSIKDRDVLELESSVKVFSQAWKWMKFIIGTAITVLVLTGGSLLWRTWGLWRSVDEAEKSVSSTAKNSTDAIAAASIKTKQEIDDTAGAVKKEIARDSTDAATQAKAVKSAAAQFRMDIARDSKTFQTDLAGSRQQLDEASKLRPEIEGLRKSVGDATKEIEAQKKILSSSADFVKGVFTTHKNEFFFLAPNFQGVPIGRYAVIPPLNEKGPTCVMLLLSETPVDGTMQLEYHVYVQAPNTYFVLAHNLVIFMWPEPTANLVGKQISVSYFGDSGDKDVIKSLSQHDGRWWADDQPLPNYGHPDTEFKGNKWTDAGGRPLKP